MGVAVGGTGVAVGGMGVAIGGRAVLVGVGGTGVAVGGSVVGLGLTSAIAFSIVELVGDGAAVGSVRGVAAATVAAVVAVVEGTPTAPGAPVGVGAEQAIARRSTTGSKRENMALPPGRRSGQPTG
jgi:hypothetical protein